MRLRFAFLILCSILGATAANAQFNAILINFTQPLMSACEGGTPIPDGATVQIFWDSLGNGPTDDDRQPVEGPNFLQVNFNQFLLNGESLEFGPGLFGTEPEFTMVSGIPDPEDGTGHPLYWLRLCLDSQGIFWRTDTFRISTGLGEYYFGVGEDEFPFTCMTGVCGGCPTPAVVTNPAASTTHCDSIVVTWNHDMNDIAGYRILIDNNPPFIYVQGAANTRYVDLASAGGEDHEYRVRAYRICGTGQDADTTYSTYVPTIGRKIVAPPIPQNMTATDDSCALVKLVWSINTVLGLDQFRIYREGVQIGTVPRVNAGTYTYYDNTPLPGVSEYCVYSYSEVCGLGASVCDNGSAAGAPNCTITNLTATGDCDEVCVTFTADCNDVTEFAVWRTGVSVGTVTNTGGPNFEFCHAPTPGQVGNYQIQPRNLCGAGTLQPATPVQASRLAPPVAPTGVAASDTLCDMVRVTWTAMANVNSFEIFKNNTSIGTAAGNATSFDYTAATPGVTDQYTVKAINECGPSTASTANAGTRVGPGTGTATFTVTTVGPPNWSYSMTVTSGCLNEVIIRDFCEGTTATAPTGWTVEVDDDSIIFSSTEVYSVGETVPGFELHHPTCDGDGRWTIGDSDGTIRGPLPVGANVELPTEYDVNVYPNPFNPMTNFKIAVPQASDTRIIVFNIMGQIVRDMNMGRLQAGFHTIQFGGAELPSGMYFARVQSGNFHSTHKLMLLK